MSKTEQKDYRPYVIGAFIALTLVAAFYLGANIVGEVTTYFDDSVAIGDIVLYDYTIRLSDGTVLDTSIESVGIRNNITKSVFTPVAITTIAPSLDSTELNDAVIGMNKGETKTITITQKRDPALVVNLNRTLFDEQGITPEVGELVSLQNSVGYILQFDENNVMVDFNSPFAGQELDYELNVVAIYKEI